MQLLFTESEEFGAYHGINIIPGRVVKFNEDKSKEYFKVPHVGWSQIFNKPSKFNTSWLNTPLSAIPNGEYMYFVHSFYCIPIEQNISLSVTNYEGTEFCSSLLTKNIFATQFHPEKSAELGIKIYKDWASSINYFKTTGKYR